MELKKNPNMDIGRNSSLYFAIGLNLMLLFTWQMLEYKTYNKKEVALETLNINKIIEDDIPIVNFEAPPPPPPSPVVVQTIVIVEDLEDVEETIIESSETGQDEAIEEYIAKVEEVEVEEVEEYVEIPFAALESVPIFPGCEGGTKTEVKKCFQQKIQEHVAKNFNYPESALEMGIYGKVYVLFLIDSNGVVSRIKSRGPDKVLEKEAERIIKLLPKMIPGKQRGKPVNVPYSIPINFQIKS
ncbi:energy transducer TonB [Ichthyenterobacterium magnum]|uniref:Outer membrane transport energization protein TonB n=1 Tax=Ichthyenterobacterium magnum TaxID=1230530 RepID=A0A420DGL3_9FLAO|nr:energy transducer TonB [Ichthyenterobacterium magnum]RKE92228.1 outer membrane transport energization protein TonB [Ichthyenterobacterium magnum]